MVLLGVSGSRAQAEGRASNIPDSHAAPTRPTIFAVVNAVDAIASIILGMTWVDC